MPMISDSNSHARWIRHDSTPSDRRIAISGRRFTTDASRAWNIRYTPTMSASVERMVRFKRNAAVICSAEDSRLLGVSIAN